MTMTSTKAPSTTMTRAVITGPKQIRMERMDVPTPEPNQVLVRVRAAALCTWEQRTFAGIAFGRNIWSTPDPEAATRSFVEAIHPASRPTSTRQAVSA